MLLLMACNNETTQYTVCVKGAGTFIKMGNDEKVPLASSSDWSTFRAEPDDNRRRRRPSRKLKPSDTTCRMCPSGFTSTGGLPESTFCYPSTSPPMGFTFSFTRNVKENTLSAGDSASRARATVVAYGFATSLARIFSEYYNDGVTVEVKAVRPLGCRSETHHFMAEAHTIEEDSPRELSEKGESNSTHDTTMNHSSKL